MSNRPNDGDTGVNSFMLMVIFVLFGGIAAYTLFSPQGRPATPRDVDNAVRNNLRQLSFAAEKYFVEHPGVDSVAYTTLNATAPKQYLPPLVPVAGETYPGVIRRWAPVTATGVAGTRTVGYNIARESNLITGPTGAAAPAGP